MGHFSCSISFSKSDQKHICLSQIPFSVSDHKPKHSTVICSFLFSLQDTLSPKKKMSYYFHSKVFFPFLLKLCQSHSNCKHKLFAKRIILNESIYEERIIKFSDVLPEISINMWLRETKPKATKISDFAWENVTKNCHKNLQIGKNKNEQTKWICISFKRTWVTASPQIFLEKAKKIPCRSKNAERRLKYSFTCTIYAKQVFPFFCGSLAAGQPWRALSSFLNWGYYRMVFQLDFLYLRHETSVFIRAFKTWDRYI